MKWNGQKRLKRLKKIGTRRAYTGSNQNILCWWISVRPTQKDSEHWLRGLFIFVSVFLAWKSPAVAVAQTPCLGFRRSDNHKWKNQMPTPPVFSFVYSSLPNQTCARISCSFLANKRAIFHLDEKLSHGMWKATHPSLLIIERWAIINDQKHWSFGSASRSGCGTVSHHRGLKDFEIRYSYYRKRSCEARSWRELSEQLLVSMKPSEIDMKNDISRPSVGVLVFSFQLAITPPL